MQKIKWLIGFFILAIIFYIYDVNPAMQELKLMHATEIQLKKEIHEKNNKANKNNNLIKYLDLQQNELIEFFIEHSAASGMAIQSIDLITQQQKNQLKTMMFKIVMQSHSYASLIQFVDLITNNKYFLNIEGVHVHFINAVNVEFKLKIIVTNIFLASFNKKNDFSCLTVLKLKNGVTKIMALNNPMMCEKNKLKEVR